MLTKNNIQYRQLEEQVGYLTSLMNLLPVGFNKDNFKGIITDPETLEAGQFGLKKSEIADYFYLWYRDYSEELVNLGEFPKQGPRGAQGVGIEGPKGNPGVGWKTGFGVPTFLGQDGEMYYDIQTYDIYRWDSAGWTLVGNIKGPVGPQGPQGPQGPVGRRGAEGVQGQRGEPGASYRVEGIVNNIDQLPDPNNLAYLVRVNSLSEADPIYHLFFPIDSAWVDVGPILPQEINVLSSLGDSDTDTVSQRVITDNINQLREEIANAVSYPIPAAAISNVGYAGDLKDFAIETMSGKAIDPDGRIVNNPEYVTYKVYFGPDYNYETHPSLLLYKVSCPIITDKDVEVVPDDDYTTTIGAIDINDSFSYVDFNDLYFSLKFSSDEYVSLNPIEPATNTSSWLSLPQREVPAAHFTEYTTADIGNRKDINTQAPVATTALNMLFVPNTQFFTNKHEYFEYWLENEDATRYFGLFLEKAERDDVFTVTLTTNDEYQGEISINIPDVYTYSIQGGFGFRIIVNTQTEPTQTELTRSTHSYRYEFVCYPAGQEEVALAEGDFGEYGLPLTGNYIETSTFPLYIYKSYPHYDKIVFGGLQFGTETDRLYIPDDFLICSADIASTSTDDWLPIFRSLEDYLSVSPAPTHIFFVPRPNTEQNTTWYWEVWKLCKALGITLVPVYLSDYEQQQELADYNSLVKNLDNTLYIKQLTQLSVLSMITY